MAEGTKKVRIPDESTWARCNTSRVKAYHTMTPNKIASSSLQLFKSSASTTVSKQRQQQQLYNAVLQLTMATNGRISPVSLGAPINTTTTTRHFHAGLWAPNTKFHINTKSAAAPCATNSHRNYSIMSKLSQYFASGSSGAPNPPQDIDSIKGMASKEAYEYIKQEREHFNTWKRSSETQRHHSYVSEYFSSLSNAQQSQQPLDIMIRDGWIYYFLDHHCSRTNSMDKLFVRIRQDDVKDASESGSIPSGEQVLKMYEEKHQDLQILLDKETLWRHHSEWISTGAADSGRSSTTNASSGPPAMCSISCVTVNGDIMAYALERAYSAPHETETHESAAIFVRSLSDEDGLKDSSPILDSIFPENTRFYANKRKLRRQLEASEGAVIEAFSSVEIGRDGNDSYVFYVMRDDNLRPFAAARHRIGDSEHKDEVLVFEGENAAMHVDLRKTADLSYLTFYSGTNQETEVRFLSAQSASQDLRLIERRKKGLRYYIEHIDDYFYIFTNSGDSEDLKIMRTRVEEPSLTNWEPFAESTQSGSSTQSTEHRDTSHSGEHSTSIVEVEVLKSHLILYEMVRNGDTQIRRVNVNDGTSQVTKLPLKYAEMAPTVTPQFDSTSIYFSLSSVISPKHYYHMDIHTGTLSEYAPPEQVPFYDEENFQMHRVEVPSSSDSSIRIPMVIAHHKRINTKSGDNKILLLGYGAYRDYITYPYQHNFSLLLSRGYVLAFAQCRGGGELGRSWYDSGRLLNKKNTFHDFVDCAEYFVKEGWTKEGGIVARGTSAGALTAAVAANWKPSLFAGLVLHVPFLDIIHTMSDPSLPNTVSEYEEFGDAKQKDIRSYMESYAPIENLAQSVRQASEQGKSFPRVYITTSEHDMIAPYWNAFKYSAALRKEQQNVLVNCEQTKDHSEFSLENEAMQEGIQLEHAFIVSCFDQGDEKGE